METKAVEITIQLTEMELVTIKEAMQIALDEKCDELIRISLSKPFGAKETICKSLDYEVTNISAAKTKLDLIILNQFNKKYA